MYSIAQVLNPEFTRSWHEAVAIVQEVASQLQPGLAVPGAQDLLLDDAGALSFGFGSESNENPVTALAALLDALLTGTDVPTGLRDLAAENNQLSPAHATIQGFSRALAFYERPNRSNDLAAVAGRLRASQKSAVADSEFERLREKVAAKAESKESPPTSPIKRLRVTRRQQIAAAGIIVMMVAVTWLVRSGGAALLPRGLIKAAEGNLDRAVAVGLDRLGVHTAAPEAAPSPPPTATPAPEEPKPKAAPSRPSRTQAPPSRSLPSAPSARVPGNRDVRAVPPAPVDQSSAVFPVERASVERVAPPQPPPAATVDTASVYTRHDFGVQPPKFIRPQIPREPTPGADTGYFEVLIDEAGDVEQVKLISPMRRYHERMLMAAAKAWKFKPAMIDGVPVKYRMQVPINLPGMPWP